MLDYGKVTDTIYKRSVRKVIERNVPGAGDDRIGRKGYIIVLQRTVIKRC